MATHNFIISLNFPYYQKHGRNFIASFLNCTPNDCKLTVYNENSFDKDRQAGYYDMGQDFCSDRVEFRDLWEVSNVGEWQKKCIVIQEQKTGLPVAFDPHERIKQRSLGYDYRFDALAHSKAMFAQKHHLSTLNEGDKVLFFDVDVIWLKNLTPEFFESAFPKDVDLEFLGRKSHHSETGYFAYRNVKTTREFYDKIVWYYTSTEVFSLPYWTDSHIFDHVRTTEFVDKIKFKNVSEIADGHVFINSFLGHYLDHLKGARKLDGRSPENEYTLYKKPKSELKLIDDAGVDAMSVNIKRPPSDFNSALRLYREYIKLHLMMPYAQKMPRDNLIIAHMFRNKLDESIKTVGDFGGMTGWAGYILKHKFGLKDIKYICYDINDAAMAAGKEFFPEFTFAHCDINNDLPGNYDLTWSTQMMMSFDEAAKFIDRLYKISNKMLYYTWPHHDQDENIFAKFMNKKYGNKVVVCQRVGRFDVLILRKNV